MEKLLGVWLCRTPKYMEEKVIKWRFQPVQSGAKNLSSKSDGDEGSVWRQITVQAKNVYLKVYWLAEYIAHQDAFFYYYWNTTDHISSKQLSKHLFMDWKPPNESVGWISVIMKKRPSPFLYIRLHDRWLIFDWSMAITRLRHIVICSSDFTWAWFSPIHHPIH